MNISIGGSSKLNEFEVFSIEEKIKSVMQILPNLNKVNIHVSDYRGRFKVKVLSEIQIRKATKHLRYHNLAVDKNEGVDDALNTLSRKYFKISNKNRFYKREIHLPATG